MLYLGKRNPGSLTASSPGDTLIFPFATYNDSGQSIGIGGTLAITDIEVLKDGAATVRATDSGYSLISDTGQVADRLGLFRVRIQLFNTADDANFYAVGSSYQVFIDSITVDSRIVRFWLGTFEIGEPRANIVQVAGDTGAANYLKTTFANGFNDTGVSNRFDRVQFEVDTGLRVHIDDSDTGVKSALSQSIAWLDTGLRANIAAGSTDTGAVSRAVWNSLRSQHGDTGSFGEHLGGSLGTATVDTGVVNQAVWQGNASRTLTAFALDTGVADTVWKYTSRGITAISDTGINDRLGRVQSDVDTGLRAHISDVDTGLHATLAGLSVSVDTGSVNNAIWNGLRASHVGAGTFGEYVQANIKSVNSVEVQGSGTSGDPWQPV